MEKLIEKNNLLKLFVLFISELVCFWIIKINLISYDIQNIYDSAINIVQGLYFLAVLAVSIYIFISNKSHKSLIINSTIGLIIYSIILHFSITSIVSCLTKISGVINFVKYASKIYFICLPLVGFRILTIKKRHIKKSYFLICLRVILLVLITFLFNYCFNLKGVLYAIPLNEFIIFVILIILVFKKNTTRS